MCFNFFFLGKLNVDCCNYLYFFFDFVNNFLKIGIINLKYNVYICLKIGKVGWFVLRYIIILFGLSILFIFFNVIK